MSTFEIVLRLIAATLIGAAIGLNRDLRGKPIGLRTLGLVALGSTAATLAALQIGTPDSASRVMQGILTGIGFLGAGVIVHRDQKSHIHRLTTAACVFLTAAIGVTCAVGNWRLIVVASLLGFAVLVLGGPLEKLVRHRLHPLDKTHPLDNVHPFDTPPGSPQE